MATGPRDYISDFSSASRKAAVKRIRGVFSRIGHIGREADEDFRDALYSGWARYAERAEDDEYFKSHKPLETEQDEMDFFLWCCEKSAQARVDEIRRRPVSPLDERVPDSCARIGDLTRKRKQRRTLADALFVSDEQFQRARFAVLAISDWEAATILQVLGGAKVDQPSISALRSAMKAFELALSADRPAPARNVWVSNLELLRLLDDVYSGTSVTEVEIQSVKPASIPSRMRNAVVATAQQLLFDAGAA